MKAKFPPREFRRRRPTFKSKMPSKTDQSQATACELRSIMERYKKTGQISHIAKYQGTYEDMTLRPPDLLNAMTTLTTAQQAFDALPASTRARFGNSPVQLVEFLSNPKNAEEALSMKLINSIPEKWKTKSENQNTQKPNTENKNTVKKKESQTTTNPNDDE